MHPPDGPSIELREAPAPDVAPDALADQRIVFPSLADIEHCPDSGCVGLQDEAHGRKPPKSEWNRVS